MAKIAGIVTKVDTQVKSVPDANKIMASDINIITSTINTNDDVAIAEALARSNADTALQNNIDAEATSRENADVLKANIANPTFTGTVGGITKAMVGLGNVDNTSDASKPVSTLQATALALKLDKTSVNTGAFNATDNVNPSTQKSTFDKFNPLIDAEETARQKEVIKLQSAKTNKSLGKNLLNPNDENVKNGFFFNPDGTTGSNSSLALSGYIAVKVNDVLSVNWTIGSSNNVFLNEDLSFNSSTSTATSTAPVDGYFRTSVLGNQSTWQSNSRQVEFNSVSTIFEAFTEIQDSKDYTDSEILKTKSVNTQWTSNEDINKRITSLYLIGLDLSKKYYINQIANRNTGFKTIRIFEKDGNNTAVEVARMSSSSAAIDGQYLLISSFGGSSITGFIFMDLVNFYELSGIVEYLDLSLVTVKNTVLINHFTSDFLEKDDTIRVNKINPLDIEFGKQLTNIGTQLSVVKSNTDFYNTPKIIPIANNESVTISNFKLFQCGYWIINDSRTILQQGNFSSNNDNGSETVVNNTGEDAYFAIKTRKRLMENGEYLQIEYSATKSNYEGYLFNPIRESRVEIVLPKKIYLLKNDISNIYKINTLLANPVTNYQMELVGFNNSNSLAYPRQFNLTPQSNGNIVNSLRVLNDRFCTSRVLVDFEILTKATSGTLNVLTLGDSFTDISVWQKAFNEKGVADGLTINMIGLKNALNSSHSESQTGGTLGNSFLVSRGNAFLLSGVTSFLNDNTSDGFGAAKYTDTNSNVYSFDGRKVDGSGNGLIRLIPESHSNTPPANGTLTKTSGTSNFNTITYTTVETINRNPFWNPSTNEVDISYYLQKFSYESDLDLTNALTKFIIPMQFSWNENADFYDIADLTLEINNFKTFIDKFHLEYPNAYVIVGLETTSSLSGGLNSNRILGVQVGRLEFAKKVFETFENDSNYNSFCFVNPGYAFVDLVNGFNTEQVALSSRFPSVTATKAIDPTHLNTGGMQQLGDSYYPILQKILSL